MYIVIHNCKFYCGNNFVKIKIMERHEHYVTSHITGDKFQQNTNKNILINISQVNDVIAVLRLALGDIWNSMTSDKFEQISCQ